MLTVCPHPVLAAGRWSVAVPHEPGESIAGYLVRSGVQIPDDAPAWLAVDGQLVPSDLWHIAKPRPGTTITLRIGAAGGDDSNPIAAVALIALTVASGGIGASLAGAMGFTAGTAAFATASAFAAGAVMVVGGMAINSLFAPPRSSLAAATSDDTSPTYSISGGQNRARSYQPMPLVIGTHKVVPDLGAAPYTECEGDDQYLYQVFCFGAANGMDFSEVKIGDTPLSSYADVDVEWSNNGVLTRFPANVDTTAGGGLTVAGGAVTRTSGPNATALAVELAGSLFYVGDAGLQARSVEIWIQYRPVGSSTWLPLAYDVMAPDATAFWSVGYWTPLDGGSMWVQAGYDVTPSGTSAAAHTEGDSQYTAITLPDGTSIPLVWHWYAVADARAAGHALPPAIARPQTVHKVTLTSASRQPVRRTFKLAVPAGQYEVRVARDTPDETDPRATSDIAWTQLRTYQADAAPAAYEGQYRLGLKIRASAQLQGSISELSAVVRAYAVYPVRVNGVMQWRHGATSNPAAWFAQFALGFRGADGTGPLLWGAGLPPARLDISNLVAWGEWCTAQGLTCNMVIDRSMSCAEVLSTIARCGRASWSWATGKLGVVWDAADQPSIAMFGMANIVAGSFSVDWAAGKMADELVLNYVDAANGYVPASIRVPANVANPTYTESVDWMGCTSAALAAQHANLLLAANRYRSRKITWETDAEGMVVTRGDVVTLSHDLTQWGYSGRLVGATIDAGGAAVVEEAAGGAIGGSAIGTAAIGAFGARGTSVGGPAMVLQLDRSVPRTQGTPAYVAVVLPDGTELIRRCQDGPTGEISELRLMASLPTLPGADPAFIGSPICDWKWRYDYSATPGKRVKIVAIEPVSTTRVKIVAVDEYPQYYAAINGTFSPVAPPTVYASATPVIDDIRWADQIVQSGTGYATQVSAAWRVRGDVASVRWLLTLNGSVIESRVVSEGSRLDVQAPDTGTLVWYATPFDSLGRPGARVNGTHTIDAAAPPPPAIASVTATALLGTIVVQWTPLASVWVERVEVLRADSNSVASAVVVAPLDASARMYRDPVGITGATKYYWLRAVSKSGSVGAVSAVASATSALVSAGDVASLSAGQITGQLTDAQVASLSAAKVLGQLTDAQILSLTAAKVSGTISDAQLSAIAAAKVTGQLSNDQIAAIAAGKVTGQLLDTQLAAIAASKVSGALTDAQIQSLAAAKVTGLLTDAQIQAVAAGKVTGQISDTQLAAIAAGKITGTLLDSQLAAIAATKVTGQLNDAQIAGLAAAKLSGLLTDSQIQAVAAGKVTGQISDTQLAAIAAGKITGTLLDSQLAALSASKLTGALATSQIAAHAVTNTWSSSAVPVPSWALPLSSTWYTTTWATTIASVPVVSVTATLAGGDVTVSISVKGRVSGARAAGGVGNIGRCWWSIDVSGATSAQYPIHDYAAAALWNGSGYADGATTAHYPVADIATKIKFSGVTGTVTIQLQAYCRFAVAASYGITMTSGGARTVTEAHLVVQEMLR